MGFPHRKCHIIYITAILALLSPFPSSSLDLVTLDSVCGQSVSFETSFRIDSNTGLTYSNLLDCSYTVTVPSGLFVLGIVTRFEIEAALTGSCTDYLEVYDGVDSSASALTVAGRLCGSGSSIPENFTSSGESMTMRLVTDNSGVYTGFNMVFAAVHNAPCSVDEVSCNNSLCIDSSLACDGYNQCGDSSDEDNCTDVVAGSSVDIVMIVVIVLSVLVAVGLVVAYIVYRVHENNKWKRFLNDQDDKNFRDVIVEPGPSYPITHKYYKGIRGHPNQAFTLRTSDKEGKESPIDFKESYGTGTSADHESTGAVSAPVL